MRITIMMIGLLMSLNILAQNTSGKVIYKEITNLKLDSVISESFDDSLIQTNIQDVELEEMLSQFSSPEIKRQLLFNPNASSFKVATKSKNERMESDDGSQVFQFVMMVPEEELYIDLSKKEAVEQKEFMDKKFLLKYSIDKQEWKLTGKQKTVADKLCFEAKLKNDTNMTTAWFCPEIPIPAGPDIYGQLPGLILELTTNKGKLTYEAIEISFGDTDAEQLVAPSKGKKVSPEKYRKIVEAKTREMKEVNGGQMIIEVKTM